MSANALMSAFMAQTPNPEEGLKATEILLAMSHSVGTGVVVAFATYFASKKLYNLYTSEEQASGPDVEMVFGAANLLFLSVGLTGLMLLISNNVVRAFGIIAAIAIVRFRIKLDQKSLNSSLAFAILGGLACGAAEFSLAWSLVGVYIFLLVSFVLFVMLVRGHTQKTVILKKDPVSNPMVNSDLPLPEEQNGMPL